MAGYFASGRPLLSVSLCLMCACVCACACIVCVMFERVVHVVVQCGVGAL